MTAVSDYTQPPHGNRQDLRNLRQLLPYLKNYMSRVMLALSCLILAKLANVGIPVFLKYVVDALDSIQQAGPVLPLGLLLGYGAVRMMSSLFNELRDSLFARVRYGAMRELSVQLMKHLLNLSLRFHLDRETGAISRDLDRGTRSASSILNYLTFNILPTMVEVFLITVFLLVNYSVFFCLITVLTIALYFIYTFMVTNWRMGFRHQMNALDSKGNSQAMDGLLNYETIKYFNNESYEINRYTDTLSRWENAAVKSQTSMSMLNFGQGVIITLGVTAVMILAAYEVAQARMTIGDLVLVNAFLLQLFIPLGFLGIIYRQTRYALADMDLFFKLLGQNAEIKDQPGAPALQVRQGRVCFRHVDFSYLPERQILDSVDFSIEAGQKLAVVGPSGSGKSTLVRLLFRFFEPDSGEILIDGQNIRTVSQDSLRAAIGIVPQDTVLFNESIFYNIQYGNPTAPREQVYEAARTAHIHDFIVTLPDGYDTVVGERGLKLSGGEKQRVAIARVVLKKPKILVFDEATSALDSHSEQAILKALAEVAKNHTTLVIAHRLSTIVDADRILVLQQGGVVESGTHQQLLAKQDAYAAMWALQQEQN